MTSTTSIREVYSIKNVSNLRSYHDNGYMIFKTKNDILTTLILNEIIANKLFDPKTKLKKRAFNGDNGEEQFGRDVVHLARMKNSKKNRRKYKKLINLIEELKTGLLSEIANLGLSLSNGAHATTFLKSTFSELEGPQVIHCDDHYDLQNYEQSAIVMIALEDNTLLRVISGSHKYDTLQQMLEDKEDNCKFSRPTLVRTHKNECLLMHPKLFHSGWTCESDNTRLQIYLGYERPNVTQIMGDKIAAFFNGTNASKQIKSIKADFIKRKKSKAQHLN